MIFSISKLISFRKTLFLSLVLFCFHANLFAQSMNPQQQAKVDSLMQWINLQIANGTPIDQHHIDSVNALVKSMNPPMNSKSDSVTTVKNDSGVEIEKQGMVGTSFTVPANKKWIVKQVFCNDGGSYNVLVTSIKFEPLKAGEKLYVPSWSAEAELLNKDSSMFNYIFRIEESNE